MHYLNFTPRLWTISLFLTLPIFLRAGALGTAEVCYTEACGESEYPLRPLTPSALATRSLLTNAERLTLHLPLKPPTRRRSNVPRADPSSLPVYTVTGVIQLKQQSDGASLGYIDATPTASTGNFKSTTSLASALRVSIQLPVGATSGTAINIKMLNSPGPLLGLVEGRINDSTDIGPYWFNYLYFNGVALPGSEPGAIPAIMDNNYNTLTGRSKTAETSVWNVDLTTGALSAQWINADTIYNHKPTTYLWVQVGTLYAGGDMSAFDDIFTATCIPMSLSFVEDT